MPDGAFAGGAGEWPVGTHSARDGAVAAPYNPPMIEIQGLAKRYGPRAAPVLALSDVTLSLGPGVWAVVGPNGAGKTTLLGLVLGFLHPTSGEVRIDGVRPRRYLRRRGAGYLPERFSLPPQWPTRSAITALSGFDGGGALSRAADALARFGLEEHADKPVGALSRGLNQRLGLAQALTSPHDLIVLDEPTEGLDPIWRVRFRDVVHELRRRGATVLLASHELMEVERLADHVILLENGRVREVMETPTASGHSPHRYAIDLVVPGDAVAAAFPGAHPAARPLVVEVADSADLSQRLAALLQGGAIVASVTPVTEGLEARVRRTLGDA